MSAGQAFDIHPAGMLALDVARIEAGLLLIDVDFNSSKKALIEEQKYSPFEMGLSRLVSLEKNRFVGRAALTAEMKKRRSHAREIREAWKLIGPLWRRSYENVGLPPAVSAIGASRVAVPVFSRTAHRSARLRRAPGHRRKNDCAGHRKASTRSPARG